MLLFLLGNHDWGRLLGVALGRVALLRVALLRVALRRVALLRVALGRTLLRVPLLCSKKGRHAAPLKIRVVKTASGRG